MTTIERRLSKFIFPVEGRQVFFADSNGVPKETKECKAIVRWDKNK